MSQHFYSSFPYQFHTAVQQPHKYAKHSLAIHVTGKCVPRAIRLCLIKNVVSNSHSQYAMPTVLGTSADVTIQSTVFSSLRGNITQEMASSKITRTNQIDARYNSYAVCKSETYNPFLNLEHTVHREQGFLVYIPINNELQLQDMILSFSFYRPANLTGGFALRSRSLTTTKGMVLQTDAAPFSEVNYPPHVANRAVMKC